MTKKAGGGFKKDKFGFPDPLHFDLAHHHKKLLEVIYVVAIVGAIVSIIIYSNVKVQSADEANTNAMVLLFLVILLGIIIVEKSLVSHKAHKPKKSSS